MSKCVEAQTQILPQEVKEKIIIAWAAKLIIHVEQVEDVVAADTRRPQVDHQEEKMFNHVPINSHTARLASSMRLHNNC